MTRVGSQRHRKNIHLSLGTEGHHERCHYNLKSEMLTLELQNTKQECSPHSVAIFTAVKSTSAKKNVISYH